MPPLFWQATPITALKRAIALAQGTAGLMQPARHNPQPYGTVRRDALALARLSAIFFSASLVSFDAPASAQVAAPAPQAAALPDAIKQREQELEATRTQQKSSVELQQQFKAEIAGPDVAAD